MRLSLIQLQLQIHHSSFCMFPSPWPLKLKFLIWSFLHLLDVTINEVSDVLHQSIHVLLDWHWCQFSHLLRRPPQLAQTLDEVSISGHDHDWPQKSFQQQTLLWIWTTFSICGLLVRFSPFRICQVCSPLQGWFWISSWLTLQRFLLKAFNKSFATSSLITVWRFSYSTNSFSVLIANLLCSLHGLWLKTIPPLDFSFLSAVKLQTDLLKVGEVFYRICHPWMLHSACQSHWITTDSWLPSLNPTIAPYSFLQLMKVLFTFKSNRERLPIIGKLLGPAGKYFILLTRMTRKTVW